MRYLRASFRLLILCGATAAYYLRWLCGLPFVSAFPERARSWRGRNFSGWARASARIVGMKVNAHNAPPASPFLLVSNHLSYVDIAVLESQVDCAFVAKSEVANWPILGFVCRTLGTIFVDRKQKRDVLRAMAQAKDTLNQGLGVVLFPEGTSTRGPTTLPFKSSLLEFAAQRRMPVHYASISYVVPHHEPPAQQSVCWGGTMTFPGHLFRLLQLSEFEANVTFGLQPILNDDRRVLAAELRSAVNAQLMQFGAESYVPIRSGTNHENPNSHFIADDHPGDRR